MLMDTVPMQDSLESDLELGLVQNSNSTLVVNHASTADIQFQPSDPVPSQIDVMQDILGDTATHSYFGDFLDLDQDHLLDDIDFSFLDNTFIRPSQTSPAYPPLSSASEPSPCSTTMGVGAEVYRKSHVHRGWEPGREENQESEHQNLNLPQNVRLECPDPSSVTIQMLKKPLSLSLRDRILAMILRTASTPSAERIVASFPPPEILRDLIYLAFVRMRDLQAIPVVHMPSFDLNKQRPELLAALIAYGSIYSSSQSVRKFGYAMQETVRIAIHQLVRTNYSPLCCVFTHHHK
jgi:hypothetical protein